MEFTRFEKDLNIISALDNEPNDAGGMSSSELKAEFDKAGNYVKEFVNKTMLPEMQQAFENTASKEDLSGIVLGQIPDGTITPDKLAPEFTDMLNEQLEPVSKLKRLDNGLGNEYVWAKCDGEWIVEETLVTTLNYFMYSNPFSPLPYADEIAFTSEGVPYLVNPQTVTYTSGTPAANFYNTFLGKYIDVSGINSSGSPLLGVLKVPDTQTEFGCTYDSSGWRGSNLRVISGKRNTTPVAYVNSEAPDAYPPAEHDGFSYVSLGRIASSADRVGDIKVSTRTDLNDSWLLCNGEMFSTDDYPGFAAEAGFNYIVSSPGGNNPSYANGVCYDGETFVACIQTSQYPMIAVGKKQNATQYAWTATTPISFGGQPNAICKSGDTYVCVGYLSSGNQPFAMTKVGDAAWTYRQISTSAVYVWGVAEHDGTVVAVGWDKSTQYPYAFVTTNPESTSWTTIQLSTNKSQLNSVAYGDGVWVAVGDNGKCYTSRNPIDSNSWTERVIGTTKNTFRHVYYADGVWVATGSGSGYGAAFAVTENPEGEWKLFEHGYIKSVTMGGLTKCDGKWMAFGIASTTYEILEFTSKNPLGGWSLRTFSANPNTSVIRCVTSGGGQVVLVGSNTSNVSTALVGPVLPTISVSGAHTYIKAKED